MSGPDRIAARAPAVKSDVLSDVLGAVRLTGAVYFDFELRSPWVAEAPPSRDIANVVMPGAEHVIEYHVIARGGCWGHGYRSRHRHQCWLWGWGEYRHPD